MKKYQTPKLRLFFIIFLYVAAYMSCIFFVNHYFYKQLNKADDVLFKSGMEYGLYRAELNFSDFLYVDDKGKDCLNTYCLDNIRENKIYITLKSLGFAMVGTYDDRDFGFIDVLFFTNPKLYNFLFLFFILGGILKKIHKYQFFYFEDNEQIDNIQENKKENTRIEGDKKFVTPSFVKKSKK